MNVTEQEEDVAVKEVELQLAQTTMAYWRDELDRVRSVPESPEEISKVLLSVQQAKSAVRVAEIRLAAAKSRLAQQRIEK
jgi:hypothetical protein